MSTINRIKKFAFAFPCLGLLAMVLVSSASAPRVSAGSEASDMFASKCAGCHGAKAEKRFNRGLPDGQLIDIVLKGKKVEKPPFMPAWGSKGISGAQAKALVSYMKSLR
jgi:mono/diheme cytochrome c family protein